MHAGLAGSWAMVNRVSLGPGQVLNVHACPSYVCTRTNAESHMTLYFLMPDQYPCPYFLVDSHYPAAIALYFRAKVGC